MLNQKIHYYFRILTDFSFQFILSSYIVGSETARALDSWRYALRVTPFLGILAVVLIYMTREPERGQSEGSHNLEATSYKEDLIGIFSLSSFISRILRLNF